ncbi:1,2-dihydroxy-3-keto-5-methylthiopentene dioxygenase [Sporothrix bragantina]|uniref:1,2-dihydroxy-3-keto-5-methylthiopentene dioxygenase n=1 Tax=Sporothrix bragantina TaxID=671064 RepID=A0ABP0BSH2_9PEZI
MSWNGQGNMGPSPGNGLGGLVGGDMAGGQGGNQPHATEYTLQGVMRFLQTEWHRHERDRNAWEIEKQEMKGRIASLEGSARRADATQKALKKYVSILEKKVKEQSSMLKNQTSGGATDKPEIADKQQQANKILDKLRGMQDDKEPLGLESGPGAGAVGAGDEEEQRSELRQFLDQCQAEFTYLMVTPANPMPPRESPPLPLMEDLREDEFGLPAGQQQLDQFAPPAARNTNQQNQNQNQLFRQQQQQQQQQHQQQSQIPANHVNQSQQQQQLNQQAQVNAGAYGQRSTELQPTPMTRSGADMNSSAFPSATTPSDWTPQAAQDSLEDRERSVGDPLRDITNETASTPDSDAWDFNDGPTSFPEPSPQALAQQQQQQQVSNRPDTDIFPAADSIPKSPNRLSGSHRRKGSMSRRRSGEHELGLGGALAQKTQKTETGNFKMRFGLRGHLDTVRTVIFSGGGSPGEPEICTAGDDGLIKRFHIPRTTYMASGNVSDLDVQADFTHRGHNGAVLCLASWFAAPNFATGGRAQGDGWIFSGGQDNFVRVWERGRVDPKATLDGHTDAVWALCVLPATLGAVFGPNSTTYGSPDRIILVSGAADGTVRVWAVSAPPQMTSPQPAGATGAPSGGRRGGAAGGRVRGNSMSSGSGFPSSPQPTVASNSPFSYTLIHTISRPNNKASPTSITALSGSGGAFVVSYSDAAILVYDTRTGEEIGSMASLETYDGTPATSVNAVVATTVGLEQPQLGDEDLGTGGTGGAGPTGGGRRSMAGSGVEGVIISGHEDQFIRFFDANSGQCTYNMLAHPAAISSLSLSPDGRELVSAGHDASLRFWSLEKRSCTQEITAHRIMRGEGVCDVVWSQDGRWVVSGGGDGVVKVFAR